MNRKLQIGIVLGTLTLMIAAFLYIRSFRNQVHDLPGIIESGRLSVLTDSSRTGFSNKGDSIYGFQYEVIKAFADSLGLELVITEESDIKNCMEKIKSGDYDIIADFIPITTEWQNDALFTIPLLTTRQVLVQRIPEDSTQHQLIYHQIQLANDTLFVPVNSPYIMRIRNLSNEIASPIQIIEMKNASTEQMVRMVSEGKIKYTICNEQFARRLKLQYPNIDVSIPIGFEQHLAWAVHKKSPLLLEKLNGFLTDFIGSTAYWEIYRKYY